MVVQCCICKRIRVDGRYRLPWPGELDGEIAETYCPRCAQERLEEIQNGTVLRLAELRLQRRAAM